MDIECGSGIFLSSDDLSTASAVSLAEIAGIDFLMITDATAHAGLDCYAISVDSDTVFNEILVDGANVVTAKGLSGVTVHTGTLLTFGKSHATSIDLVSGQVTAYIH
jgi:hypothetical protein